MPSTTPDHLEARGAAFYEAATSGADLSAAQLASVTAAAEVIDHIAALDAITKERGLTAPSSQGERAAPWLVEARQQRLVLVKLLGALDLPATAAATDDLDALLARPAHLIPVSN